jgi:cation diffusion facilitator family transporter
MASGSKKVIYAALIGNSLISITKFAAAISTRSSAMMSEGIHSLVDTGNQFLLLHGIKKSQQKPDEEFPFGYGKELYFWSFAVSIIIFAVGAGFSLYEGIHSLKAPTASGDPTLNYIILSASILFESGAWWFAYKEFNKVKGPLNYLEAIQRGKDPTMFVVLFEDSAALLGLVIAMAGIYLSHSTGNPIFDSIASILIGLILAVTAIWLAYETKSLLIGESASSNIVLGIKRIIGVNNDVEDDPAVLTMHMGADNILVNISINYKDHIQNIEAIKKTNQDFEQAIMKEFPVVKNIFIEIH